MSHGGADESASGGDAGGDVRTAFQHTPLSALVRYPLVSVAPSTPLREAVEVFRRENVGTLVIVEDGKLVGIVTERDLVEKAYRSTTPGDAPVSAVMKADPSRLTPQDMVTDVLRLLDHEGHRHVPITDDEGRPLGVLSVRDVLEFVAEALPEAVLNQPPEPTQPLPTSEGA